MKYLYTKDGIVYAECEECRKVLKFRECDLDQVSTGVTCFCGNTNNVISGLPVKANTAPVPQVIIQQPAITDYGPKCPTCGSHNVQKISLASKAVGGYMFGILSSNIRNTYKCNNCGYKW